jgi:putative glutamine amidotransferase
MPEGEGGVMVVGITDSMRPDHAHYERWIQRAAPDSEVVKLSCVLGNARELERCDGLLLTGGGDVHPRSYGREDALPAVKGVNVQRDEFEFGIINAATQLHLPVLGICRGMQVFNVATGGTMIPDVLAAGFRDHRKSDAGADRSHSVRVDRGSLLHALVKTDHGEVNSSHHQAVERPGKRLRAVAWSEDGIVEALEREGGSEDPFLLLVQWHPERMNNVESPFSRLILERFVRELIHRQPTTSH